MRHSPLSRLNNRSQFLAIALISLYTCLVVQFFRLQILQASSWRALARKQHILTLKEPARRGRFLANAQVKLDHPWSEKVLVSDTPKFHLHVDPLSLPREDREPVAKYLSSQLPPPELASSEFVKIMGQMKRSSRDRILMEWLEPSERNAVEAWWLQYHRSRRIPRNALFFTCDYQRTYPLGCMMGSVLQTVRRQRDEGHGSIPIGGLELSLNSYLVGSAGTRHLLRSQKNPMETGWVTRPAQQGADIHLTVNHVLQALAERELARGAERVGARAGWAVMIDPWNGHILALAQYPTFDLSKYGEFFGSPFERATRPSAICDAHELGSVLKPLHLAIALKANDQLRANNQASLFDPEEPLDTFDGRFPGRKRPLRDVTQRRFCNLNLALQKSSNIYMARLAHEIVRRLGAKWYRDQWVALGFDEATGVEVGGESRGSLPGLASMHASGRAGWSVPTPASLSLGHSIQLNALQVARAYCALANGGTLIQPRLVKKITSSLKPDQLIEKTSPPRGGCRQVLTEAISQRILQAMRFVTSPGGTGYRGAIPGYSSCGKTGTAEKVIGGHYDKRRYFSSFIGITPASNPRFVLLVSLDEPRWGYQEGIGFNHRAGICAAPIFKEIAAKALEYLSVPNDNPQTLPVGDRRGVDCKQGGKDVELEQLHQLDQKWNGR